MSDQYAQLYRKKQLVGMLYAQGAVKRGEFKLSSGKTSNIYIDGRLAVLDPNTLSLVAPLVANIITDLSFDSIGCMEGPGSVSLLGAMLLAYGLKGHEQIISGFVVRKKAKEHGTGKMVEGFVGKHPILIDDVATSGKSLIHAIDNMGIIPVLAVVILDRNEGAKELLAERGIELKSVLTLQDLGV